MNPHVPRLLSAAITLVALAITACGGGGDAPAPALSAAGLREGSTSANRSVELLIVDSGRFYAIYGFPGASAVPTAGFIVGDGASDGNAFSSSNLRNFDTQAHTVTSGSLSGTFAAQGAMNATVTYPGNGVVLTTTYDTSYDGSPSLSTLAGTYGGEISGIGGADASALSIDGSGIVAGSTTGGCTYVGLATPRDRGNVYDLALTFRAGCADDGKTLRGQAFLKGKLLYAVVVSGDLSAGEVFAGFKP